MFISVKEAGLRLRKSRWTVTQLIKSGELQAVKGPTPKAHIDVVEQSVTDYIARRLIVPVAAGTARDPEETDSGESQ